MKGVVVSFQFLLFVPGVKFGFNICVFVFFFLLSELVSIPYSLFLHTLLNVYSYCLGSYLAAAVHTSYFLYVGVSLHRYLTLSL